MRRYFGPHRARRFCLALLFLLLTPPASAALQSPYQGIYLGTFQSPDDEGEFALLIDRHNRALLAAYDTVDDDGFSEHNVHIRSDGSFRLLTRRGYRIDGQVAAGGVSGHYTAGDSIGVFSAERAADQGPLAQAAGYYSGPASLTATGSGAQLTSTTRLSAIVAADGRAFFLLERAAANFADVAWPFGFERAFFWPFDWGWDWHWDFDFQVPFLLPFGFAGDFQFSLPSFGFSWPWQHAFNTSNASGGIVALASDGYIDAALADGMLVQGRLEPSTGNGQGALSQQIGATLWSGDWYIERHPLEVLRGATHLPRLSDFNGDGRADILWRHAVSGENAVWLMDGVTLRAELALETQPKMSWALVATDHFDDDLQPDLLWRHDAGAELLIWLSSAAEALPITLDGDWQVVGSGDFVADGRSEILLRNRITGANALLADVAGQTALLALAPLPDRNWSVLAADHFDGDAYRDILWRNRETDELLIWRMRGQNLIGELSIPAQPAHSWTLLGSIDFDGDGVSDILYRDSVNGSLTIMLLADGAVAAQVDLNLGLDLTWRLVASGDFDGDGTDDLLWRHGPSGVMTVWRTADADSEVLTAVADPHWTVQP